MQGWKHLLCGSVRSPPPLTTGARRSGHKRFQHSPSSSLVREALLESEPRETRPRAHGGCESKGDHVDTHTGDDLEPGLGLVIRGRGQVRGGPLQVWLQGSPKEVGHTGEAAEGGGVGILEKALGMGWRGGHSPASGTVRPMLPTPASLALRTHRHHVGAVLVTELEGVEGAGER